MPKKAAEPTAEPLEQAAGPPIIGETDVEKRLEQELADMEARASPDAPAEPPDAPAGASAEAQPEGTFLRPPRRRKTPRRAEEEASPPAPAAEEQPPADGAAVTAPPAPPERPRRPAIPMGARVFTIDEQGSVETPDDKARSDLLDLTESRKGGKILTGILQGVERNPKTPSMITAVLYHGDFKIVIPVNEAITPPLEFHSRNKGDVMHYLLTKRLGSEIDYIVKGVDDENHVAVASRMEAMAEKRKQFYNGRSAIREGATAEARVVCVIRTGVFMEIFGVEAYVPLRELSYQRWMDAAQHFQPGQRVLVKILSVNRENPEDITVEASVKQVGENPYEKVLSRYTVGNQYVGTVSVVDTRGVFVSLEGGVDCLCLFPKRGRPPRGSRVTVRIKGIDSKSNRIWGSITHMTTF